MAEAPGGGALATLSFDGGRVPDGDSHTKRRSRQDRIRHMNATDPPHPDFVAGIGLAALLAFVSYHLLNEPVGLSSEPTTAGDLLAPSPASGRQRRDRHHRNAQASDRRKRARPRTLSSAGQAPPAQAQPPAPRSAGSGTDVTAAATIPATRRR